MIWKSYVSSIFSYSITISLASSSSISESLEDVVLLFKIAWDINLNSSWRFFSPIYELWNYTILFLRSETLLYSVESLGNVSLLFMKLSCSREAECELLMLFVLNTYRIWAIVTPLPDCSDFFFDFLLELLDIIAAEFYLFIFCFIYYYKFYLN